MGDFLSFWILLQTVQLSSTPCAVTIDEGVCYINRLIVKSSFDSTAWDMSGMVVSVFNCFRYEKMDSTLFDVLIFSCELETEFLLTKERKFSISSLIMWIFSRKLGDVPSLKVLFVMTFLLN
jgi:hypothetical protein